MLLLLSFGYDFNRVLRYIFYILLYCIGIAWVDTIRNFLRLLVGDEVYIPLVATERFRLFQGYPIGLSAFCLAPHQDLMRERPVASDGPTE